MDTQDARIAALIAAVQRIAASGGADDGADAGDDPVTELARAVNGAAEVLARPAELADAPETLRPPGDDDLDPDLFRVAIAQAADAVFWMNAEGGFDYVNAQACSSLGYTRDELMRLRLWDIDPTMSPARYVLHWRSYGARGAAVRRFESRHRRKDGSTFPVEVSSRHLTVGGRPFHLAFTRDVSERKRADEALRLTQFCIDTASVAIFRIDRDGHIVSANEQACRNLGYSRDELLALDVFDIASRRRDEWPSYFATVRELGSLTFEATQRRKDGSEFPVEVMVNHIDAEGSEYLFSFARDITAKRAAERERDSLEAQLVQAQKMESIGRLAGGIAHDFNNMLAIILGYTELLQHDLPAGDPMRADLAEIERAAARSRDITRQLLAFSRKQVVSPQLVDLTALVDVIERTLRRLVGEDITLVVEHEAGPAVVLIDPSQVDQIIVNLVVNARDAMPAGGRITLRTRDVLLDEADCQRHLDLRPGRFICLEVADTGHGMTEEVLAHVFEPFFTTKGVGEGTGLGLATVYGIVRQNGGFVTAASAPGHGAVFRIYLPRAASAETLDAEAADQIGAFDARALLVEDDAGVRQVAVRLLHQLGLTVTAVGTPGEGLALLADGLPAELLISDIVMPGMSGIELVERARRLRPTLPVLYISAHAATSLALGGEGDETIGFVQKPFDLAALSRALRRVLSLDAVRRPG